MCTHGHNNMVKILNHHITSLIFFIIANFCISIFLFTLLKGANYLNWYGLQAQLVVTEAELVKEILNNKDGNYPKIDLEGYAKKLLGDGVSSSKGQKWAKMRKLSNNVFHAESLKVRDFLKLKN